MHRYRATQACRAQSTYSHFWSEKGPKSRVYHERDTLNHGTGAWAYLKLCFVCCRASSRGVTYIRECTSGREEERKSGREGWRISNGIVPDISPACKKEERETGSTLGASRGDTRYLCWCQNYAYKVKIRLLVVLLDGLGEQ